MKEALVKIDQPFVADEESAEVTQVSKGAFHFPALAVAAQRASILQDRAAVGTMRADQLDATRGELPAETRAVVGAIHDEALRAAARTARSEARHFHCGERFRGEGDFGGRGAKESASHRNTRAVCHHHPLRTFSA